MATAPITNPNVKQAVPFFGVTNMEASLRFYVDGLGFRMKHRWIPSPAERNPEGRIRWCWLQLGEASIMLQEYLPEHRPKEPLGTGTSVCFMCDDALANGCSRAKRFLRAEPLGTGTSVCFMCDDALALYREFKSRGIQT